MRKESVFRRYRALLLLVALLTVILTVPLTAGSGISGIVVRLFYTVVFCVAGYLLSMGKRWVTWYLVLAVPSFILGVICSGDSETGSLDILRNFITIGLQILLISAVVKFSLLNPKATDLDRIIAGICGYLILGIFWSDIYVIVEHFSPGALVHSSGAPVSATDGTFMYFSLVTLTTLGYGDFTPTTSWSRILSALEAVMGTLYLAILIASIMSGIRRKQD